MTQKSFFVKKHLEEIPLTAYFHFENNYCIEYMEVHHNRVIRFSEEAGDILPDQPLSEIDDLAKEDIITEEDFRTVWNDSNLDEIVRFIPFGDIFTISGVTSYAHGCNCVGAMGAGIAVQFKRRFPEMYTLYHKMCKHGTFLPGDVFDYHYGSGHVYNLGTQESWKTSAKLEYIAIAIDRMLELAERCQVPAIALPAIGAGLGGLKWHDVKAVIKNAAKFHPKVTLYVVESYRP